jgi:hypothetical protein
VKEKWQKLENSSSTLGSLESEKFLTSYPRKKTNQFKLVQGQVIEG